MKTRNKQLKCDNCGQGLNHAENFCPNCGQENHVPNKPFRHLFLEVFETLFHFDTKFFHSAKYLLMYPGRITKEYNENKRARFVPPFRLYIFVSAIFFLIFQFQSKIYIKKNSEHNNEAFIFNPGKKETSDSATVVGPTFTLKVNGIDIESEKQRDSLLNLNDEELDSFFQTHNREQSRFNKAIFKQILKFSKSSWDNVTTVWMESIRFFSIGLILLMPAMGLIVQLCYIRQKRNYYEYLLFSLHYHTAFFTLFSIGFIFNLVDGFSSWPLWIMLLLFFYLLFSLKENFQQSWFRTITKTIFISFVYTILISFGIIAATLLSMIYS